MSNKAIIFEDKKIKKSNFHKNKKLFDIHVLVPKKESYGEKIHLNAS